MNSVCVPLRVYSVADLRDAKNVAEGTTARVSRASLQGLQVAVKTLKPLDEIEEPITREHAVTDFENEMKINAQLRHPNIMLFIGCIRSKKLDSLIFEFCDGGVLKCSRYGPSRIQKGLAICSGVARALCFAHGLNIIHRDVKPSQILLHGEVPKLGDWGLATYATPEGCTTGETGTWEFMAPEVIRHEKYGLPADVFSFGMLMYCLITGVDYPYMEKFLTPAQAAAGVVKHDLRPDLGSQVPEVVSHIITNCWAADPEARPSMTQVMNMLEKAQGICAMKSASASNSWSTWIWG
ncbi:Protein kinase domain containing protein [Gracilaria domingensis]|nr:Protein kinase domain containing protein [Gracilaria domingensis]